MSKPAPSERGTAKQQKGQSIVELSVMLPFLLLLVLGAVEMGVVFSTYLAVSNAAREGAIFASMYPQLASGSCASVPQPYCTGSGDNAMYAGSNSVTVWEEYFKRVANESFVAVGEPLRAQQLIQSSTFRVDRPVAPSTALGSGITVTVHYTVASFTSGMSFPFFGRMGLPNVYHVNYSMAMPIR